MKFPDNIDSLPTDEQRALYAQQVEEERAAASAKRDDPWVPDGAVSEPEKSEKATKAKKIEG